MLFRFTVRTRRSKTFHSPQNEFHKSCQITKTKCVSLQFWLEPEESCRDHFSVTFHSEDDQRVTYYSFSTFADFYPSSLANEQFTSLDLVITGYFNMKRSDVDVLCFLFRVECFLLRSLLNK